MGNMEINVNEADRLLTTKPIKASDVERIMIYYSMRDKYTDEPQPVKFGHMLYELLDRVSVPLEKYDLVAGRVVSRELTPVEEEIYRAFVWAHDNPRFTAMYGLGHATYSWDYVLEYGLPGLKERALKRSEECGEGMLEEEKKTFLLGAALVYDALINYLHRYAEHAKNLGMDTLAESCMKAADGKPDSFRSALQLLWTVTLVECSYLDANPTLTLGRLDVLLYPYYMADIEKGILTPDEAHDLITDYYCKHNLNMGRGEHQVGGEDLNTTFERIYNFDAPQYLLLGGTDNDGKSAVNELTQIFADCIVPSFKNPVIVFRYHKNLNTMYPELWAVLVKKAMQSASMMFYNDDDIITAFKGMGLPDRDARNYTHFGCNWPSTGDNGAWMSSAPGSGQLVPDMTDEDRKYLNVPAQYPRSGLGLPMDYMNIVREMAKRDDGNLTIDDVYDEFFKMYDDTVAAKIEGISREVTMRQRRPSRLLTFGDCFLRDSITNGMTFAAGAKYHFQIMPVHGFGTTVDCFIVTDQLVFRDKEMTLAHLVEAADANFVGYDRELALCRSVEKYGSNSELSNYHVHRLAEMLASILRERNKPYFEKQRVFLETSIQGDTWHLKMGEKAGATVDGRLAGHAYSHCSRPAYGTCINGLSGMLNSMLSIPFDQYMSGALNLDIQPSQFGGENGEMLFGALLGTYFNNGGLQAQVSSVNVCDLIAAQKNPDEHRDLRVRVTGYSGVFVDLCKRLQDDVIHRVSNS